MHRSSYTGRPGQAAAWVTVRGQIMGLAHSDDHLVEFLRLVSLPDAFDLLDDPGWVEWQGGLPHEYGSN